MMSYVPCAADRYRLMVKGDAEGYVHAAFAHVSPTLISHTHKSVGHSNPLHLLLVPAEIIMTTCVFVCMHVIYACCVCACAHIWCMYVLTCVLCYIYHTGVGSLTTPSLET